MADLARLAMQFETTGADQTVRTLDQVAEKSERAERASASLGKGMSKTGSAAGALSGGAQNASGAVARLAGDLANGGSATEALGRSLPSLASGLGIGATGFLSFAAAAVIAWDQVEKFRESQQRVEALANGVGAAVGLTAASIETAARAGAEASNISIAAAEKQALQYAMTGKIGSEMLTNLMGITAKYADATGVDAASAVRELGAAFADPERGAEKLTDKLRFLNGAQLEHIETLARQGDHLAAQDVLYDALAGRLVGTAVHVRGLIGWWIELKNAASNAGRAMLIAAGGGSAVQRLREETKKLDIIRSAPLALKSDLERQTQLVNQLTAAVKGQTAARLAAKQNAESVETQSFIDRVLPKEAALRELLADRVRVENNLKRGIIDRSTAQRMLNEIDQKAIDLQKGPKSPKAGGGGRVGLSDADRAAKQAAADAERAAEATRRYIQTLGDEIEAIGLTADALKRLSAAREIEAALKRGDAASAATIHSLMLEREEREELAKGLKEATANTKELGKAEVELIVTTAKLPTVLEQTKTSAIDTFQRMAEVADDVSWSIEGIADALRNQDWMGAARSAVRAIESIKKAWATGSKEDKFAAAAGVANGIGQAIGGKAGGALSGAASGALAGFSVGGPIGAGIGAIIGGISGLFGASKAEKQAKKEAAARKAAEEAERVARVAAEKRGLEIHLMELSGDEIGALAARRADELAATDASNRGLLERVYALEDEAAAAEKAKQAAAELAEARAFFDQNFLTEAEQLAPVMARVSTELAALGFAGVTTMEQFRAAVLGLDQSTAAGAEAYRALLALAPDFVKVTKQQDDYAQAANDAARATNALTESMGAWSEIANRLGTYSKSLSAQSAANQSPMAAFRQAKSAFDALRPGVAAGNVDAISQIEAVGNAYIEARRAIATDNRDLAAVIGQVQQLTMEAEQFARSQSGDAYRELIGVGESTNAELAALRAENAQARAAAAESDKQVQDLTRRVATATERMETLIRKQTLLAEEAA